jgi:hypothetical protein
MSFSVFCHSWVVLQLGINILEKSLTKFILLELWSNEISHDYLQGSQKLQVNWMMNKVL